MRYLQYLLIILPWFIRVFFNMIFSKNSFSDAWICESEEKNIITPLCNFIFVFSFSVLFISFFEKFLDIKLQFWQGFLIIMSPILPGFIIKMIISFYEYLTSIFYIQRNIFDEDRFLYISYWYGLIFYIILMIIFFIYKILF